VVQILHSLHAFNSGKEDNLTLVQDFSPIMVARLKYRPIVSTLMYTIVPVDRRVVFGSACGVIWGIYLSLYAAV
jgi:protein Mpv17